VALIYHICGVDVCVDNTVELGSEGMRDYLKLRLFHNLLDNKDIDDFIDAINVYQKRMSEKIQKYEKALNDIANIDLWSKKTLSKEREIAIEVLGLRNTE